ncbi:histidine kinase dimerization/phospho-acceptor domain-containing protein [Halonotius pteroides]|uniref:histidine kinase n=1 Tax=Halonotius pteroides TaxID=268735 RepID=A0A3A6PXC8_9EURY|nr:PAS domain-containing sensor histidine kinase [Halonotius pteroides]RJX47868.1 hypothetical protein DP106_13730 [Halonotius pteroides]
MAAVADYPDTPVLLLMNPGPKPVVVELSDPLDIERGPDVPAQKTVLSHHVELAMTDEQTARNRSAPDTSTIYERITDGFFAVDRDWEYTYVNSEGAALTDRPRAELIGTRVWDAFPELVDTPFEDALRRAMDSGETTEVEAHYQPHGIWYDVRAYPDDNGISIYFRDITQRVARRKKLERENERLEQFANIISHDLRNPLAVAQGNVELVKDEHGTTDELETVSRALDRMEALIDDMLALARQEQGIKETDSISLPEIAEDCWTTIESADATLEVVSGYGFTGDKQRVKQLFENIFRNAIEHGGPADPTIANRHTDSEVFTDADADLLVRVGSLDDEDGFYIENSGADIPETEHDRIFENGYSTGEEGLGLGLTIVKGIVSAHDWDIAVTDGSLSGPRFEISAVKPE